MDGRRDEHDFAVCRDGTYDKALVGIKAAVEMGYPGDNEHDPLRRARIPTLFVNSSTS